jgi:UDP-N-acetylglucosamine acyltransferase
MSIHPTAIIDSNVKLGKNVSIGAYSFISGEIEIGDDCQIMNHVNINGNTKLGVGNKIFPFASIGTAPQDLKYKGEKTYLEIGNNNIIREHVTINLGTITGNTITKIGNNCLFMVGAHIAHDCVLGNNVILANNATLAGHVVVGDFAIIGGLSAVHQFVRVGHHAMIGGMSGIDGDVIPYGNAYGKRANLQGLNLIGLKRRGFDKKSILDLMSAFKNLFLEEGQIKDKIELIKVKFPENNQINEILEFIITAEDRALCKPTKSKFQKKNLKK